MAKRWTGTARHRRCDCAGDRRGHRRHGRDAARSRRSTTHPAERVPRWSCSSSRPPISPGWTRSRLSRWLPVSGTVQPLRQATVKAKVSGDVRQVPGAGRRIRARRASCWRASIPPTSRRSSSSATARSNRRRPSSRWPPRRRRPTRQLLKQNFISQNAYDNSESSFGVSQGTVKSAGGPGPARPQRAARCASPCPRSTGVVAKRHVQVGEKVAFDSPLVTVVDLTDMELQAAVPAVDVPELAIGKAVELTIDGFGERRFTGRVERINPAAEPGTRAILVYVGIPNSDGALRGGMFATGRIALAASAPVPTLAGNGHAHRGRTDVRVDGRGRQAREARRHDRPHATTPPGASRSRPRSPPDTPVLAAQLRQPEGRGAGDRQGAAPAPVSGVGAGDDADVRHERRPRADARPTEERRPCGSHESRSTIRSSPRW